MIPLTDARFERVVSWLRSQGLDEVPHLGQSLLSHLRGTCLVLRGWQEPEAVCLGGLCHSVYGTEAFGPGPVPLAMRSTVASVAGREAEELAYLFGAIRGRRALWLPPAADGRCVVADRFARTARAITEARAAELVTIALANLIEQAPRLDPLILSREIVPFLRAPRFSGLAAKADLFRVIVAGVALPRPPGC